MQDTGMLKVEPERLAINTIFRVDVPTFYTDNVNIDSDGEAVVLNFCNTLPGYDTREIDGEQVKVKQAPVFVRVAMTREHFKRFIRMCEGLDLSEEQ